MRIMILSATTLRPGWGGCDPDEAHAEASIFWLAGQQGYCKDYVIAALKGEETRSAFLESLVREVENEASSINVLTFLCTMTLGAVDRDAGKLDAGRPQGRAAN